MQQEKPEQPGNGEKQQRREEDEVIKQRGERGPLADNYGTTQQEPMERATRGSPS